MSRIQKAEGGASGPKIQPSCHRALPLREEGQPRGKDGNRTRPAGFPEKPSHPHLSPHYLGREGKGLHSTPALQLGRRPREGRGWTGSTEVGGRPPFPDAQFPRRPTSCQEGEASSCQRVGSRRGHHWAEDSDAGAGTQPRPTTLQPSELCFAGGKGAEEAQAAGVGPTFDSGPVLVISTF